MTEIPGRHDDAARTDGLGRQRIDGEGVLGVDDRLSRRAEGLGRQHENVVRPVAEGQPVRRHAEAPGHLFAQVMGVTVGVAPDLGHRLDGSAPGAVRHSQRILVGSELDDLRRIEPVGTGHFLDGTAALVRRDRLHIGRRAPDHIGIGTGIDIRTGIDIGTGIGAGGGRVRWHRETPCREFGEVDGSASCQRGPEVGYDPSDLNSDERALTSASAAATAASSSWPIRSMWK